MPSVPYENVELDISEYHRLERSAQTLSDWVQNQPFFPPELTTKVGLVDSQCVIDRLNVLLECERMSHLRAKLNEEGFKLLEWKGGWHGRMGAYERLHVSLTANGLSYRGMTSRDYEQRLLVIEEKVKERIAKGKSIGCDFTDSAEMERRHALQRLSYELVSRLITPLELVGLCSTINTDFTSLPMRIEEGLKKAFKGREYQLFPAMVC